MASINELSSIKENDQNKQNEYDNIRSTINMGTGIVDVFNLDKGADYETLMRNKNIVFNKKNVEIHDSKGGKKQKANFDLLFGDDNYELLNLKAKSIKNNNEKKIGLNVITEFDDKIWGNPVNDIVVMVKDKHKIKQNIQKPSKIDIYAFASKDFFIYDCEKKYNGVFPENSTIVPSLYKFTETLTFVEFIENKSLFKYVDTIGNVFYKYSTSEDKKDEIVKILKPFEESQKKLIKSIKKGDKIKIYYKDKLALEKIYFITDDEKDSDKQMGKNIDLWTLKVSRIKGNDIFNYIDKKFEVRTYFYDKYSSFIGSLVVKDISILYENEWNSKSQALVADFSNGGRPDWAGYGEKIQKYLTNVDKSKKFRTKLKYLKLLNKAYRTMIILRRIIWEFFKKKYNVVLVKKYFKMFVSFIRYVSKLNVAHADEEEEGEQNDMKISNLLEDIKSIKLSPEEQLFYDTVVDSVNPFLIDDYHTFRRNYDIYTNGKEKTTFDFSTLEASNTMNKIMIEFLETSNKMVGKAYGDEYVNLDKTLEFINQLGEYELVVKWKNYDNKRQKIIGQLINNDNLIQSWIKQAYNITFEYNNKILRRFLQELANEQNSGIDMFKVTNDIVYSAFKDNLMDGRIQVFKKKLGLGDEPINNGDKLYQFMNFYITGRSDKFAEKDEEKYSVTELKLYGTDKKWVIKSAVLLPAEIHPGYPQIDTINQSGIENEYKDYINSYTKLLNDSFSLHNKNVDLKIQNNVEASKKKIAKKVGLKLKKKDVKENKKKSKYKEIKNDGNDENEEEEEYDESGIDKNNDKKIDIGEMKNALTDEEAKEAHKVELISEIRKIAIHKEKNVKQAECKEIADKLDIIKKQIETNNDKKPKEKHTIGLELLNTTISELRTTMNYKTAKKINEMFTNLLLDVNKYLQDPENKDIIKTNQKGKIVDINDNEISVGIKSSDDDEKMGGS